MTISMHTEPFFKYVNERKICAFPCVLTFMLVSFVRFVLKKYNTKNFLQNYQNTTDNGESGNNNSVIVNRNHDNSLPPPYESTNPAPDPTHESGEKHEATKLSLCDARKFSKLHPPNENLPIPEEIENIIIQDGYKAWKFISEDIIIRAQRVFTSDDERIVEFRTNYPFFIPYIHAANSKEIDLDVMHYFEITVLNKVSNSTTVAIGITTKPYPYFRLLEWNQNSIGYHSDDGRKFCNDEFASKDYGPKWGKLGMAFAGLRHVWCPSKLILEMKNLYTMMLKDVELALASDLNK